MPYLHYLCLVAYSSVQHILCCGFVLFFFVLCCQFLWIVHFDWPFGFLYRLFTINFIYCRRFAVFNASSELPSDSEAAVVFWMNKVCSTVQSKEQKGSQVLEGQSKIKVCHMYVRVIKCFMKLLDLHHCFACCHSNKKYNIYQSLEGVVVVVIVW
jgi:hypothetical protein